MQERAVSSMFERKKADDPPDLNRVPEPALSVEDMFAAARRQWRFAAMCTIAFVTLGALYLATAVPRYTATTSVLIDGRRNQDQLSASIAELNFDTAAIDSQLEVIASDNVALGVVKALMLDEDPQFTTFGESVSGIVAGFIRNLTDMRRWFTSESFDDAERRSKATRAAVLKLQAHLAVRRIARTYVLQISFTWPNAARAVQIANAYADAYFADQLEARYDLTRRASGWLQNRIKELKENSLRTDLAVQKFKARHGLVSNGTSLVSEQQLSEITTQMSVARSDTARAAARLDQINDILKSGRADGAVTESLGNPVINDLRSKYLRASKSAAELSARVGEKHYQVRSLRIEMAQYERLIFEELQRIAETYVADLDVARAREKSFERSMSEKIDQQATSNEVMVNLRELERESDTFKTLYQTFLQRYQDAIQRESFPTSEARVISPASVPDRPSSPKASLVLGLSGVLGLLAGAATGAVRERRDRVFRTGQHVRDMLALDCLGMAPEISEQVRPSDASCEPGSVHSDSRRLRHSIDAPFSSFAEALRAAKVAVDLAVESGQGARVIGIVSVLPREGKTTISKNLASFLALLGGRTLLIDADLRNPGLTRAVASHASAGLLEVLAGEIDLADAILGETGTGLHILPAVDRRRSMQSSGILASNVMGELIAAARKNHDYIVVDLPPIGPVVDVRACSYLFDSFILVAKWGKTPREIVRSVLLQDCEIHRKCVGVILNKVATERLCLYEKHGDRSRYHPAYEGYYRNSPDDPAT